MPKLIAIGDSHAAFWRGRNAVSGEDSIFKGLDVEHLGPATAFNLFAQKEQSKYVTLLNTRMQRRASKYGAAIMCFGEIDCRVHLVRSALRNKSSLPESVQAVIKRYMEFVDWFVEAYRMPVVLWGPGPSTPPSRFSFNPDYPAVGSSLERNYAASLFNEFCKLECKTRARVEHASIFQSLINAEGITKPESLYDGCHVDIWSMDLAITELTHALARLGISELAANLQRRWLVTPNPRLCNVAEGLVAEPSSRLGGYAPLKLTGSPNGQACFRTNADLKPRARIDLRAGYLIQDIYIYGISGNLEKCRSLSVEGGLDPSMHSIIYSKDRDEWSPLPSTAPLVIRVDPDLGPIRFIQVYLQESVEFELDTINVAAPTFDATIPSQLF